MLPRIQYISSVVDRIGEAKSTEDTAITGLFTVAATCHSLDRGGTIRSTHEITRAMEMEVMIGICRKGRITAMTEAVSKVMAQARLKKSISISEEATEAAGINMLKDHPSSSKTTSAKWPNRLKLKEARPSLLRF
jgi:hypothetical protein